MRSSIKRTIWSRQLRTDQTDAETVLWNRLRNSQLDGHKYEVLSNIEGALLVIAEHLREAGTESDTTG
jgi:very-short-patch-repair endonuclease